MHACDAQTFAHVVRDTFRTKVQSGAREQHTVRNACRVQGGLLSMFTEWGVGLIFHKALPVMPISFSAIANAWVAREQWVLTLPSEQPMSCAVSVTERSSQ